MHPPKATSELPGHDAKRYIIDQISVKHVTIINPVFESKLDSGVGAAEHVRNG